MGAVATHAINPSLYASMPYDPARDFSAVTQVASTPNVLVVQPVGAAASVREFIAYAQGEPGQAQLRLRQHRQRGPPRRRALQGDGRRRDDTRALQGRGAGDERPRRRADPAHVRQPGLVAGAGARRAHPRARGDHREAQRARPGAADDRRNRPSRLRHQHLVRRLRPGGHAGRGGGAAARGIHACARDPRSARQDAHPRRRAGGEHTREFAAFIRTEADKYARVVKASGAKVD